jgi:hypothetical protein
MKNIIDFKNWNQDMFEEDYDDHFDDFENAMTSLAQEDGSSLYNLYDSCKQWITLKIIKNEFAPEEFTKYFRYAMQGVYGHIVTEEHIGELQKIWVADKFVEVKKDEQGNDTSVDKLVDFNFIASICRCEKVVEAIFRQQDPGPFFHNPNYAKSYFYPYYYLEKSMHKIDDSIIERQLNSMNTSAEGYYKDDEEWNDWYYAIYIPVSELRYAFFLGNETSFNEKLQEALHKDRAFNDTPEGRFENPDNWFPWEIISLACRAFDKGWKITVEDSRLPKFIIEGKCNVTSLEPWSHLINTQKNYHENNRTHITYLWRNTLYMLTRLYVYAI